jgi:hypothetical protein
VYCLKTNDVGIVTTSSNPPAGYCCKDTTSCSYVTNAIYTCSNKYTNTTLAKQMCPFYTDKCGSSRSFNYTNSSTAANVTVTNLENGDTCVYKVSAKCSVPSFTIKSSSRVNIEKVLTSVSVSVSNISVNST